MRGAALVAVVLLAAPVKHVDVRVKSKHDMSAPEAGAERFKVGAEESLRGAAVGPGSVRLTLRRLALPGAMPISVKVTRDGRDVERLSLGGRSGQASHGESPLASSPVERMLDIPSGPHTLFIDVGPGQGHVLVSFNEPAPTAGALADPKPEPSEAAGPPGAAPATALARREAAKPPSAKPAPGAPAGKKPAAPAGDVAASTSMASSPKARPAEAPRTSGAKPEAPAMAQAKPQSAKASAPAPERARVEAVARADAQSAPPGSRPPAREPEAPAMAQAKPQSAKASAPAPERAPVETVARADAQGAPPGSRPPAREPEAPATAQAKPQSAKASTPPPESAPVETVARADAQSAPPGSRPPVREPDPPALALAELQAAPAPERERLETGALAPAAVAAFSAPVRPARRPGRFLVGLRAGGAGQIQLGAVGPAAGATARYQPFGDPGAAAGLFLGVSADFLRYRFALDLGAANGAERNQELLLLNVPVVAEALWSFGALTRWRLIPTLGASAGVSLSQATGQGSLGSIREVAARPAFGAVAGMELPVGANRLGAEVRYLHSTTGATGAVQNFETAGALFQASWRFGL